MHIIEKSRPLSIFQDLRPGDTFYYRGKLCMKLTCREECIDHYCGFPINTINLDNFAVFHVSVNAEISFVKSKLIVGEE